MDTDDLGLSKQPQHRLDISADWAMQLASEEDNDIIYTFDNEESDIMYDENTEVLAPKRNHDNIPTIEEITASLPGVILDMLKRYPESVLAGGALRAIYDNIPSKDYDFFFTSDESFRNVSKFCAENFTFVKSAPLEQMTEYFVSGHRVQLIRTKIYGTSQEILNDFDFVCNKFAFWYHTGVKVPQQFARHAPGQEFKLLAPGTDDAMKRKLTIANVHHSLTTFERIQKFKKRGYKMKEDEFRKFLTMADDPNVPLRKDWKQQQAGKNIPGDVGAGSIPGDVGAGSYTIKYMNPTVTF